MSKADVVLTQEKIIMPTNVTMALIATAIALAFAAVHRGE
jgi:hypothetical protein